jgi:hypothetical protein
MAYFFRKNTAVARYELKRKRDGGVLLLSYATPF